MIAPHDTDGRRARSGRASARPPSATITTATPSSAIENIAGITFGSTSRTMIRRSFAPMARAAITNSRCAHASVFARVMRASTGIDTMPSVRISARNRSNDVGGLSRLFGDSTAISVSARTSAGSASRMSKLLVRIVSVLPR